VDAALVPIPGTEHQPDVPDYEKYDAPLRADALDSCDDAIVMPEVWLGALKRQPAHVFWWWLSVDHSQLFRAERAWQSRKHGLSKESTGTLLGARLAELARRPLVMRDVKRLVHITQSHYAADFVRSRLGVPAAVVSDYVTVQSTERVGRSGQRPAVSYSMGKGGVHAAFLPELVRQPVDWIPITGMTSGEVRDALARSDIYVDLGHQPGKDRMPREAAKLGAIAVVARAGAGTNRLDFPLPAEHTVTMSSDVSREAARVVTNLLSDLPHHRGLQEPYRRTLEVERDVFDQQVREVFIERTAPRTG
jgi:hypothetical protein